MKSTVIAMPVLHTGYEQIDTVKQEYLRTWERFYTGEVPLLMLRMADKPPARMNIPNSHQFYLQEKLTAPAARAVLGQLAITLGYEYTLQIDDDFDVKPSYGPNLEFALNERVTTHGAWFQAARRLPFTSRKNAPVAIGYCKYVSDTMKHIPKGSTIWDMCDNYGYYFNTKDGIWIPAAEIVEAYAKMESYIPRKQYQFSVLCGEDSLMLAYLCYFYGCDLLSIKGVFHQQHKLSMSLIPNYSAARTDLELPITKYRKTNNWQECMDDAIEEAERRAQMSYELK